MDKEQKTKNWYAILYLIILILLFKTLPKVAYGLLAVTLLAILLRMTKKK